MNRALVNRAYKEGWVGEWYWTRGGGCNMKLCWGGVCLALDKEGWVGEWYWTRGGGRKNKLCWGGVCLVFDKEGLVGEWYLTRGGGCKKISVGAGCVWSLTRRGGWVSGINKGWW